MSWHLISLPFRIAVARYDSLWDHICPKKWASRICCATCDANYIFNKLLESLLSALSIDRILASGLAILSKRLVRRMNPNRQLATSNYSHPEKSMQNLKYIPEVAATPCHRKAPAPSPGDSHTSVCWNITRLSQLVVQFTCTRTGSIKSDGISISWLSSSNFSILRCLFTDWFMSRRYH